MPDTGTPYALRYPSLDDVADVPGDLANLANDTETALNTKLATATAATTYQKKILVTTSLPTSGMVDGDIVFLIEP